MQYNAFLLKEDTMNLPFLSPDPSGLEMTLWLCAFGGSIFFGLRVMLMLVGGFADDFDTPIDDSGFDDTAGDAHHSEAAFKLISLNTISAFLMMFGWSGMSALLQFKMPIFVSMLIALVVGFASMLVTAWLYKMAMKLASPGADFSISETVGLKGTVYQRIPEGGRGKIQLTVNGFTRELNAVSQAQKDLDSFTTIVVIDTIDSDTVSVKEHTE